MTNLLWEHLCVTTTIKTILFFYSIKGTKATMTPAELNRVFLDSMSIFTVGYIPRTKLLL